LNKTKIHSRTPAILTVGPLIALSVLALLWIIRFIRIEKVLSERPTSFFSNPAYQAVLPLKNFPVHRQGYANSCGPTTIRMVYSYLVEPISEHALAEKLGFQLGRSGMLPSQFVNQLQSALKGSGYQVDHHANVSDTSFLERTYLQLEQGLPVPIYFSTVNAWNRPNYDTHFSVIIGLRPQTQEVLIANAYGFQEEMSISDLLNALKYDHFNPSPFEFKMGLLAGILNKSNFFTIKKYANPPSFLHPAGSTSSIGWLQPPPMR